MPDSRGSLASPVAQEWRWANSQRITQASSVRRLLGLKTSSCLRESNRSYTRGAALVDRMMHRWGTLTLFVLAAIPDPFFEVAAVAAGSVQMPLRRFMSAVFAGCLVRGLTLAYLGTRLPFLA
jgi:membrane protein DedA with SNARE-associated domain